LFEKSLTQVPAAKLPAGTAAQRTQRDKKFYHRVHREHGEEEEIYFILNKNYNK